MSFEICAQKRENLGRTHSRRLRRQGLVPAVIYGMGENITVSIDHIELMKSMRHQSFHASVVTLSVDGKNYAVLLKDHQMHPFKMQINHADFQLIDETKEITMSVPLEFINAEVCPGVKMDGGMVNYVMNSLEIQCLPRALPNKLVVDLQNLSATTSLLVSDIPLPEAVKAACLLKGEDLPVATIITSGKSDAEPGK